MTAKMDHLLSVVEDDVKYAQRLSSFSSPQNASVNVFTIPRHSFTAFRLSYISPVELSECSKVTLLGGIPKQWYADQNNQLWKLITKFPLRRVRKQSRMLRRYGYKTIYKKNAEKIPSASHLRRHFTWSYEGNTSTCDSYYLSDPTAEKDRASSSPVKASECKMVPPRRSQSSSDKAPMREDLSKVTCAQGPGNNDSKALLLNETAQHGITKSIPEKKDYKGMTRKSMLGFSTLNQGDEQHRESPPREDNSESNERAICSSVERFRVTGIDDNREPSEDTLRYSGHSINAATNRLNPNKKSFFDEVEHFSHLDDLSDDVSTTQAIDNLPLNQSEKVALDALQTIEKKALSIEKTPRNYGNYFDDGRKTSIVFQSTKRKIGEEIGRADSSKFPFFSVLPPYPTQLTLEENVIHDRLASKHSRHIRKRVYYARNKTSCKLKDSVGAVLGATNSLTATVRKSSGQILKKEKMLVLVKEAIQNKVPLPNFTENECFDTRVSERWKEYIVIARSTGRYDPPIVLQFYRHRHIPEIEDISHVDQKYHRNPLDFFLTRNCIVQFYSSLDKTISIQKPDERLGGFVDENIESQEGLKHFSPIKIFILRCNSIRSSGLWYKFFLDTLNRQLFTPTINLRIPQTEISIKINLNEESFQKLRALGKQEQDKLKLCFLEKGYRIFQHPILRFFTVAILEKLKLARYDSLIKKWDVENAILGCALKRYDRLEWIPCDGDSLMTGIYAFCQSHLIQYRPITNYSRETTSTTGDILEEVSPIEGFLIRLTDKYGSLRTKFGKFIITTSYFFTCDNLLFSMKAYRATPPLPIDAMIDEDSTEKEKEEVWKQWKTLPEAYNQQPYPLTSDSHIEWMNCQTTQDEYDSRDFYAFHCFHRRIDQMLKTDTMIDLSEVKDIYQGTTDDCEGDKIKYGVYKEASELFWHKSYSAEDVSRSVINIETSNGLLLKLLASSATVAEQWVTQLKKMSHYWKSKQREDTNRLLRIRRSNANLLMLNGEEETRIGENTLRWIIENGRADEHTFNANGISLSRPLIQKGPLYQKPHKHAVFSKYYVVLISGFIILFHCFHRSTTGFAKEVLEYAHYMTIPIDDCYLYSGTTTELDLLKRDRTFDEINLGSHTLPRVYGDGWRSVEDESSRCFTLWFGTRRAISSNPSPKKEKEKEYSKFSGGQHNFVDLPSALEIDLDYSERLNITDRIHYIKKLGVSGKSMVFMARSRQERDIWVMSIYDELERLRRTASFSNE
ncbi:hypothetical protein SEUBUCD646_0B02320 [Saccharomyces eubayanus]|uniref:SPO71-like protein n=1 Tax=Saccharomyces eubayanus TaxID=1080349 RepID=A0ABN8VR38_SACEU|nr:hypothetical protein SEUBUCD650_0B02330 [Saccharomyces eubayanus]CAI1857949.1 hypothetical protein SEUBUCD646_0B02320 [Saccharomyces eubayanus]